MTPERVAAAVRMRSEGKSLAAIARVLGVGQSSVARALDKLEAQYVHVLPSQESFESIDGTEPWLSTEPS